jgi:hypothetical protein
MIKLKSLNKKLLKLEASLQKDAKKLAKLKRKVETALRAECAARVSTELQRNASLTLHPLGYCERLYIKSADTSTTATPFSFHFAPCAFGGLSVSENGATRSRTWRYKILGRPGEVTIDLCCARICFPSASLAG